MLAVSSGGEIDLADVLRGNRARTLRVQFCPTDTSGTCDRAFYTVAWNGQRAVVATGLPPGVYRVIEDDGLSDAWIRLVESGRDVNVRAQYQAAVETLRGWSLPESPTPLPTLDRLRRPILVSVSEDQ